MQQFRLFRGKSGCYFVEDITTKKQSSLRTRDEAEAQRLLSAKNEAHREPLVCLQMARAYLTAADPRGEGSDLAEGDGTTSRVFTHFQIG